MNEVQKYLLIAFVQFIATIIGVVLGMYWYTEVLFWM